MENPLARKLGGFTRLGDTELNVLDELLEGARTVRSREDVAREGERAEHLYLIVKGWAFRYKRLDGRRQILAFLIPGDICDLCVPGARTMDHSLAALTRGMVRDIPVRSLDEITNRHPAIAQALRWDALVTAAIQREWTVNLGQRTAYEHLAHLFCELFLRLRAVGLARGNSCPFPLVQSNLAEATGLSAVHVNRTLQQLRGSGLIELRGRTLTIPDLGRLQSAALFNSNYLHLDEGSWTI
jgi:CRP-like cAMP-binding protein